MTKEEEILAYLRWLVELAKWEGDANAPRFERHLAQQRKTENSNLSPVRDQRA